MYPELLETINALDINSISEERKNSLQQLIDFIQSKKEKHAIINLNFICTHNSRRSHLSQIWAQVMASYFNINDVYCYSGGTEATAMFPVVGETLISQGLHIEKLSDTENPIYAVKYDENKHPIICFSKTFDDSFNPVKDFAAVMTCAHADENCPFIVGALARIPVRYEDPKAFDNSPFQLQKYEERSMQIATEMKYVFSKVN